MKTIAMAAGDFLLDQDDGQLVWVEDEDKVVQEVAEVLMVEYEPDEELNTISEDDDPDSESAIVEIEWGSELHNVENFGLPINSIPSFIGLQVREAVQRLIDLQQDLAVGVLPTSEEIDSFEVEVIPLGQLSFVFYLVVFTVDGAAAKVPSYEVDLSHITTVQDIITGLTLGG